MNRKQRDKNRDTAQVLHTQLHLVQMASSEVDRWQRLQQALNHMLATKTINVNETLNEIGFTHEQQAAAPEQIHSSTPLSGSTHAPDLPQLPGTGSALRTSLNGTTWVLHV